MTRGVRTLSHFTALALSTYIVNHLTVVVWDALIRWAQYLVQTRHLTLILRPPVKGANFAACTDSSLITGPATSVAAQDVASASYGGFTPFFEGSVAFSVECFSPRRLADSSAGSELIMATWTGKLVIEFRMLGSELGLQRAESTFLEIDASAVIDGTRVSSTALSGGAHRYATLVGRGSHPASAQNAHRHAGRHPVQACQPAVQLSAKIVLTSVRPDARR